MKLLIFIIVFAAVVFMWTGIVLPYLSNLGVPPSALGLITVELIAIAIGLHAFFSAIRTNNQAKLWLKLTLPNHIEIRTGSEDHNVYLSPGSVVAHHVVKGPAGLTVIDYVIHSNGVNLNLAVPFNPISMNIDMGVLPGLALSEGLVPQGGAKSTLALHRMLISFVE